MVFIKVLFWISLSVLFFSYVGYGLILVLINTIRKGFGKTLTENERTKYNPPVTLIIPAFNEGPVLKQKIENTLEIDYSPGSLNIILITDGSTDGSEKLVIDPAILHLHQPERKGKLAALKRAMGYVKTPIVIFSDANTMLNRQCIKKIIPHYSDPRTGGVAGEKKIISSGRYSAVGNAEGLYWKYESVMKKLDADFNTIVGAAGELFSIRTDLFRIPGENIILDDFIISMGVCLQGYKIKYEPSAFATELASVSLTDEAKRKIRISAGAYQSIKYLKGGLNIFEHPLLSFQYISRRLFRWIFCPLMILLLLITNIFIVKKYSGSSFYIWFLYGQVAFYLLVFWGWLYVRSGKWAGVMTVPFYFFFMNFCLVKGFFRFLKGNQTVLWEKSARQVTK